MIGFIDAFILAQTKLKTRKVRTGIATATSGLLFGILVLASFLIAGVQSSVDSFSKDGYGNNYYLSVNDATAFDQVDTYNIQKDPAVVARAEQLQKKRLADMAAEAKRLKLDFEASSEPVVTTVDGGTKVVDISTVSGRAAVDEYQAQQKPKAPFIQTAKEALKPYNPDAYLYSKTITPTNGEWKVMKDGREDVAKDETSSAPTQVGVFNSGDDPLQTGVTVMDSELTRPFMLKSQTWKAGNGTIPVVVTYSQAASMLKLEKLSKTATSSQKIDRIKQIRQSIVGKKELVCYRNTSSNEEIAATKAQIKQIAASKNDKDFVKPDKITALPTGSDCGAPTVTSDKRTVDQKKMDVNKELFEAKFNGYVAPKSQKIIFEVVGLSSGFNEDDLNSLSSIITGVFSTDIGNSWVIPKTMYDTVPDASKLETIVQTEQKNSVAPQIIVNTTYAKFTSFNDALKASNKYGCGFMGCDSNMKVITFPFGGGGIAFAQVKDLIYGVLKYVVLSVAALAMLIMLGIVGRAIADNKRETAVFRAIGAKRLDISAIYIMYATLLSLRTAIVALLLAIVAAVPIEYFLARDVTTEAQLLFSSSDFVRQFHLIGVNIYQLVGLLGIIVLTGIASSILPLLRAVRRNPINDMRDDT